MLNQKKAGEDKLHSLKSALAKTKNGKVSITSGEVIDVYHFNLVFSKENRSSGAIDEMGVGTFGGEVNYVGSYSTHRSQHQEYGYTQLKLREDDGEITSVVVSAELKNVKTIKLGDKVTVFNRGLGINTLGFNPEPLKNLADPNSTTFMKIMDGVVLHSELHTQSDLVSHYENELKWKFQLFRAPFLFIAFFLLVSLFFGIFKLEHPSYMVISFISVGFITALNVWSNFRQRKAWAHEVSLMKALISLPGDVLYQTFESLNHAKSLSTSPDVSDAADKADKADATTENRSELKLVDYVKKLTCLVDGGATLLPAVKGTGLPHCSSAAETIVFRVINSEVSAASVSSSFSKSTKNNGSHSESNVHSSRKVLREGEVLVEYSNGQQGDFGYRTELAELATTGDIMLYGRSISKKEDGTVNLYSPEFLHNVTKGRTTYFSHSRDKGLIKLKSSRLETIKAMGVIYLTVTAVLMGLIYLGFDINFDIRWFGFWVLLIASVPFIGTVMSLMKQVEDYKQLMSPLYEKLNKAKSMG